MYSRERKENSNKITVDVMELAEILSLGRNTAAKIGEDAGAVIRIGRRKLYIVKKIDEYMNSKAGLEVVE